MVVAVSIKMYFQCDLSAPTVDDSSFSDMADRTMSVTSSDKQFSPEKLRNVEDGEHVAGGLGLHRAECHDLDGSHRN